MTTARSTLQALRHTDYGRMLVQHVEEERAKTYQRMETEKDAEKLFRLQGELQFMRRMVQQLTSEPSHVNGS